MNPAPPNSAELLLTPDHRKVVETLGLQPGIWGALFLAVACAFAFHGSGPSGREAWIWVAIPGALGLALAGYEVWRRGNRTVLVRMGERIAVYRRGHFDLMVAPAEIATEKMPLHVMLKIGVPLGLAGVIFSAIGIVELSRRRSWAIDDLLILYMGLTCWASLASALWIRFSCRNLRVPIKGSRWLAEETVLVDPSRLREVFPELQ